MLENNKALLALIPPAFQKIIFTDSKNQLPFTTTESFPFIITSTGIIIQRRDNNKDNLNITVSIVAPLSFHNEASKSSDDTSNEPVAITEAISISFGK